MACSRSAGGSVSMRCRIVPLRDLAERDERAWRRLAASAAEPNPFMEPDCLLAVARHENFGGELEIAFAEEGDRFYACLPLRTVRRWLRAPYPYPFMTTHVRRTIECGTPLVDVDRGAEGFAAIFSALSKRPSIAGSRVLLVPKFSCDGPAFEAFQLATRTLGLRYIVTESWERGALKIRHDDDCRLSFSRKLRKSLRDTRRQLHEEMGAEPRLVDQTRDPDAVDRYLCLENSGYKGTTGIAMATAAGEPEYLRDLCRRFAKADRLRVLALMAGEQTIAMAIWLRGGDCYFGYKTTYDEKYAKYGPGVQLQVACMHYFHDLANVDRIDSCTAPRNRMALRLFPDRLCAAWVFVPLSKNPVHRLAVGAFLMARPLRAWIRALPRPRAGDPVRGMGTMGGNSSKSATC
jgi:Acetyltransferase (GNAT) domain